MGDFTRDDGRSADQHTILVLGAGYAGLSCFLELQEGLPRGYDLVLVNSDEYHWYTTELHTYVAGEAAEAVRIPLARVVAPPGRLVVGKVAHLDLKERQVELAGGERIPYEILVFGLGSEAEYFGLPGVAENSLVVGNWESAGKLRRRIKDLLDHPDGARPHIAIAGGGLTGVEVAGELADEYPGDLDLTIIEAGPQIMNGFNPDLVKAARGVLERKKGIDIRTGNPIARVDPGQITFKDGETMAFDLLVWSGGVRGNKLIQESGLEVNRRGRGVVDEYLRAKGHPDVYLVGDAAAFTDPKTEREVPPTAQAASQMGPAAGRNILNRLLGRAEVPFVPKLRGAFASLGRTEGVGYVGKENFVGIPALAIKNLVEARHAWETGAGVMPLVNRLLRGPQRYLKGRMAISRWTAAPAARPEPRDDKRNHPR